MFKIDHKKAQAAANNSAGQAATELAVFGAILIFLIGTIVRTAAGNSYTQDQNYKAMRQAMLLSWKGSESARGELAPANTSRNSASIFIVEDRLSPDISKYGDLDRTPFIAQGSGTFTYELLYPLDVTEVASNLPVMDMYINGQHFVFTTAAYFSGVPITRPHLSDCQNLPANSCSANQCYRNYREWGNTVPIVKASQFEGITLINPRVTSATAVNNAIKIFDKLVSPYNLITGVTGTGISQQGTLTQPFGSTASSSAWGKFWVWFKGAFPGTVVCTVPATIQSGKDQGALTFGNKEYEICTNPTLTYEEELLSGILFYDNTPYKLFYTMIANNGTATGPFKVTPPAACSSSSSNSCENQALSAEMPLLDYYGNPTTDGDGNSTNVEGVMQFDLQRNADYASSVKAQFPANSTPNMRNYMAWQWAATAATGITSASSISPSVLYEASPGSSPPANFKETEAQAVGEVLTAQIGLDSTTNTYPQYDIDGRLKTVTIYGISQNTTTGTPIVDYEDGQGGDLDLTWDANSCTPKPGLQTATQIFTFTQDGTYLQIKEGKLYNPETNQVVRSVNKRDTIDLIQRTIQLSSNTHRFCSATVPPTPRKIVGGVSNPVESCVDSSSGSCSAAGTASTSTADTCSCFTSDNIAKTCFDAGDNMLFVRSRLEDQRGHLWMTDTSGQLKVQR